MDRINMNSNRSIDKTPNNNEVKSIYKIPDNYSTLQSMTEIKKCVEKISSLQKVLKDSSSNSRSSFDQVDRSIITPVKIVSPTIVTKDSSVCQTTTEQITDGKYFLKILKSEQIRLLAKADAIEEEIKILTQKENECEDVLGLLRSAAGKARLLVSQKMKQFEGLCNKNMLQIPNEKFQTTNEDLQGFWDMVKLQIDHIDSLFAEIEELKCNNWILEEEFPTDKTDIVTVKSSLKKPTSKISNATTLKKDINGSQKQEARRKELLELKRKAKSAMQNKESDNNSKDPNKLEFFF